MKAIIVIVIGGIKQSDLLKTLDKNLDVQALS